MEGRYIIHITWLAANVTMSNPLPLSELVDWTAPHIQQQTTSSPAPYYFNTLSSDGHTFSTVIVVDVTSLADAQATFLYPQTWGANAASCGIISITPYNPNQPIDTLLIQRLRKRFGVKSLKKTNTDERLVELERQFRLLKLKDEIRLHPSVSTDDSSSSSTTPVDSPVLIPRAIVRKDKSKAVS